MKLVILTSWIQWVSVWEPAWEPVIINSIALGKLVLAYNKLPRELWKRTCLSGGDCLSQQYSWRWSHEENGGEGGSKCGQEHERWISSLASEAHVPTGCFELEFPLGHTSCWYRVWSGDDWTLVDRNGSDEGDVRELFLGGPCWGLVLHPSAASYPAFAFVHASHWCQHWAFWVLPAPPGSLEFLQLILASPLTAAHGFGDRRHHKVF